MSTGVYALARFQHQDNLLPAAAVIAALPAVTQWDAVDGHMHIVMKLAVAREEVPGELLALDGLADMQVAEIMAPLPATATMDPAAAHARVFIEIDHTRAGELRRCLADVPGIVECEETAGPFDLACLLQAPTFSDIQHIVDRKLQLLDGVVRIRQNRIIELTSL